MESLSISKTEELLSKNIFARMAAIPLVDRYEAYQLLDDDWTKIAVDLEIIQTEGFGATKIVDANMVVKKKGKYKKDGKVALYHLTLFKALYLPMTSKH